MGIGLQFFDGGMSMLQVCELVAAIMGLSDTAFVTTVFTNVVGFAPDTATRDGFVGLLQGSGGPLTQGQLLEIAADNDFNALQHRPGGIARERGGVRLTPALRRISSRM